MKRAASVLCLLAALAPGCGSEDRPPGMGGGAAAPPPSGATNTCARPPDGGEMCITSVKGQVSDGEGRGISLPVNLCNPTLCFSTRSDDGIFNVEVNLPLDLSTFYIHVYGYPDYGDTFLRLQRPASSVVTLETPVYVTRLGFRGTIIPEVAAVATTISAGPVTLTLPQGSRASFYLAHDARELRAGAVPQPTKYDPSMVALYALGPFGTRLSAPAELAIALPPTPAYPDGTQLAVVVLDDDLKANAGTLSTATTATVTGGVARTAPGAGISALTWVGLRASTNP